MSDLDLHAPGAIDRLLRFHRATFGGWRMVDPPADPPKDPPDDPPADPFKPPASQADLDRIISDRLARQRAQIAPEYDTFKTKAAEYDAAVEKAKTDQERAVDAARTEGKSEATLAANGRLVSAEARALAAEMKFRNPSLAVAAIDLAGVNVGDDGEVDKDAVKALLKARAESDPYLIDDGKIRVKADPSQGGGLSDDKPSVARGKELYEARHPKKATA